MYPVTFSPSQTPFFQPGIANRFSPAGYPVQNVAYSPSFVQRYYLLPVGRIERYQKNINKIVSGETNIYEKYKDNKEFKKLAGTEFYSGQQGLQNLVNTVANLEIQKNQAAIDNVNPQAGFIYGAKPIHIEAGTDISECLGNTYKVLSDNRFSPDLKKHVVNKASDLTFQVMQLGNIDEMLATEPNTRRVEQSIMSPYLLM